MSYNSNKESKITLKSTKFDRRKIQKCLELLSKTVNNVWKSTSKFNLTISQENLNKWPHGKRRWNEKNVGFCTILGSIELGSRL